jgi:hypothetical protein
VNLNSPVSRRWKSLLVRLCIVVPLLVVAAAPAPPEAINFGNAMLNKVTAGAGDPTVGPYPEEGFLPGGRGDLVAYFNSVLMAFESSADVYFPKFIEFDPQRYFNSSSPNRAKDNWVRDFARLKEKAGAT